MTAAVHRAEGVTDAEKYLKQLCDRTFLSLWSYPGVYRNQGHQGKASDGKEVCDLLVVFDNHIIVFSDKDCQFPDSGNLELDWSRWFRRGIQKSAEQVWGAERWIKTHPNRLFLDRACTRPFPIRLPDPSSAKFHRIVVAHNVSQRSRRIMGGSGSLMIAPQVVGPRHYATVKDGGSPFTIGQIDPSKGFVHVLDDTSLDIVMDTLDTITDFVAYLTKKEELITNGRLGFAAGEEDLLAYYLGRLNDHGEHDFVMPTGVQMLFINEGLWKNFIQSPQHLSQLAANRVSYTWDRLIEAFNRHILADSQYYTSQPGVANQERIIRFLAREPRTRRRMLAKSLLGLIEQTPRSKKAARVMQPSNPGDPYYVFLLLPHLENVPYDEYREVRRKLLEAYCLVTKLEFSEAEDIIGIATETGMDTGRSEDALYFDAKVWTPEDEAEAKSLQKDLGLLRTVNRFASQEWEYPIADTSPQQTPIRASQRTARYPRNKPCPCGSGKKYKRCCGSNRR